MKKTSLTTLFALAIACVGMGVAPATHAASYTNFLEGLQAEVSARLETNDVAAEKRALTSANKALNRNSKSLSQDLTALGQAGNTLNKAFPEDETLASAEDGALNQFLAEAEAQLNAVKEAAALHGDTPPTAVNNAVTKADAAYTKALEATNFAARVKALNYALNKIKVAQIQVNKSLKAPTTLEGKDVNLVIKPSEGGTQRLTLNSDGGYDDGAGEVGTWSYTRTGANTGVLYLVAEGGGTDALNVTFKSSKSGSFTLEGDEGTTGNFTVK